MQMKHEPQRREVRSPHTKRRFVIDAYLSGETTNEFYDGDELIASEQLHMHSTSALKSATDCNRWLHKGLLPDTIADSKHHRSRYAAVSPEGDCATLAGTKTHRQVQIASHGTKYALITYTDGDEVLAIEVTPLNKENSDRTALDAKAWIEHAVMPATVTKMPQST